MREHNPKIHKKISIGLTKAEYEQFCQSFETSIHRSFSEYGRTLLLSRPVIVKYHDRTIDNYIESCVSIKNALNNFLISDKLSEAEKQLIYIDIKDIKEIMIKMEVYVHQNKVHEKPS